jgi:uncharacterized protein (TIGR03437 family)
MRLNLWRMLCLCGVAGILHAQATNSNAPTVAPNGLVNGASFAAASAPNGSLAPGSIAALFGSDLATAPGQAATAPLPTKLSDTDSVIVGSTAAPLFFVSGNQINLQIPFEAMPGPLSVAVSRGGKASAPQTVTIVSASPGIFTLDAAAQGAIVNSQGSVVNGSAPAAPGDTIAVFCTGLGATTPPVASGAPAPKAPLATANLPVTASIGGMSATVSFAGLAPGYVGLYQVNVQIPAGVAPGDSVPLALTQNSVSSNTVTLAIRAAPVSARLQFSPYVNVQNGAPNFSGEPTLQIGRDGTMWITDLSPAQIWKSTDQGSTWTSIPPPLSIGGSDLDGAQDGSGRVHILDLARNLACFYYYRSVDGGKSFDVMATPGGGVWLSGDGGCDSRSRGGVVRPWVGTFGANTVYILGRETPNGTGINISADGGRTFIYSALSQRLFPELGAFAVDPVDGTLYLLGELLGPFDPNLGRNPASGIQAAMSADGGATFSFSTVVSDPQSIMAAASSPRWPSMRATMSTQRGSTIPRELGTYISAFRAIGRRPGAHRFASPTD